MKSVDFDMLQRAFVDLQSFCSPENQEKQEQRIRDLTSEIEKKQAAVSEMEDLRSDALSSADLVRGSNPGLAFAFEQRAAILLEEIERLKPRSEERKLADAQARRRGVHTLAHVLDTIDLEILRGSNGKPAK